MAEEIRKTLVQQYEEMVTKLAVNTKKIAPVDRTGNGRYAAAYEQLKEKVRKGAGEYAFCYVFGSLYVPNTPDGLDMLKKGMDKIKRKGKELIQAIFSFSFKKIHALLDELRSEIFNDLWLPLETVLINSDKEMPETLFVETLLATA